MSSRSSTPVHKSISPQQNSPSRYITVVDVYELAESINRDFEDISKQIGNKSIDIVLRKVISALETLEALVKNNERNLSEISELQQTLLKFECEKRQRISTKEALEKDFIEIEENYKKEINDLSQVIKFIQNENLNLKKQVSPFESNQPEKDSVEDLQYFVDLKMLLKQKDEIKELQQDVENYACEVENLQNNIEKLIRQNKELLRKNSSLQKQGRMLLVERSDLLRNFKMVEEDNLKLRKSMAEENKNSSFDISNIDGENSLRFSLGELRYMLEEKNQLKAKVIDLEDQLDGYRASSASSETTDLSFSTPTPAEKILCSEDVVYGPINREPEEKLNPWRYNRKSSGVRRLFRFLRELNDSST